MKIRNKLLIEPVWNRNILILTKIENELLLLIEPVWNRNLPISIEEQREKVLLIEPVWNRNVGSIIITQLGTLLF